MSGMREGTDVGGFRSRDDGGREKLKKHYACFRAKAVS